MEAYLGLGANLGDRLATSSGPWTSCPPVPASSCDARRGSGRPTRRRPRQPDFLNIVVEIDTDLDPLDLLAAVNRVESELGRVRDVRWGPRTIDIDILLIDATPIPTTASSSPTLACTNGRSSSCRSSS